MSKNSKFKNKCRTCLNGTKGLQLLTKIINDDEEETKTYAEVVKDITHIDVMDESCSEMPKNICGYCIRKLKAAYSFVQQAHEANDKLWSILNESDLDDKPINCLQEAQIDIQDCLEIKMEDEDENGENKHDLTKLQEELKKEEPEEGLGEFKTAIDKLATTKKENKESIPDKDVLETKTLSECEDEFDVDDKFDADFSKPDEGMSDSDSESTSSNDSEWAEETKTKETTSDKAKTPVKKRTRKVKETNLDDNIPTTCEQCDRVFPNASQLKRHKRITHVPEELKVQCPYCAGKFGRRHNMYAHMRIHHKDKPIEEHIIQQRKLPRQYACEKCDGTYTTKYYLLAHMKSKHDPDAQKKPQRVLLPKKRFLCTLCGGKFDTQYYLEVHIRRHTGEKPFKCDICDRAFYRPSDVQAHRRSHTGERPFKCTICDKGFARSNKLKVHIRTHSNERPYKCDECEKAFKQSKDLTIHRRIHTGERPYVCGVCHSTFTQSNSLKLHQTKQQHFVVPPPQPPPPAPVENNFTPFNKCRTCLNGSKGLQLLTKMITEEKDERKSYGEVLKDITQIDMMDESGKEMPQNICGCCVRKLKAAYAFVQQAQEANDKLLSMLNETDEDKPIDCLQEAQIDIQNCLEIKMEDEEAGENNKPDLTKIEIDFKLEEPDDGGSGAVIDTTATDKLASAKKENIPLKDVLETTNSPLQQKEIMSDSEDDYDDDDIFDKDFTQHDEKGLSDSEDESVTSNDSDWAKEKTVTIAKTKETIDKSKTPVRSKKKLKEKQVDDNIPTPCDQCDRVFPNARLLSRHKRHTHVPEELKVQCPYCTAKFGRRHNMYAHMRTHHKDENNALANRKFPRQFACEQCDGVYTSKYYLLAHMNLKHNPDNVAQKPKRVALPKKRFLCTLCGSKFDTQSNLDVHIRRHTGDKPFKCDLCERSFYRPCDVQAHRRSHTGEKPFKCTICEKPFARSNKLKIHMRTHSNERPYKCDQCEKAFKHSKDLNIHKRIHTGERPYTCGVCHSTFTQSNSLKLHQTKQQHFEIIDQCRTCFTASGGLNPLTKMSYFNKKETKSYAELLEEVTNMNIKEHKHREFPQSICDKCIRSLKIAHKFIQQAKEVNEKLYIMLNKKLSSMQNTKNAIGEKIEIKVENNALEAEGKMDCLQETQIDLETFLEIKIENKQIEKEMDSLDGLKETIENKDGDTRKRESLIIDKYNDLDDSESVDTNITDSDSDWQESEKVSDRKLPKQKVDKKIINVATESNNSVFEGKYNDSNNNKDDSETNKIPTKTKFLSKMNKCLNEEIVESAVPCNVCNKIFQNSKALESHLKISHIPDDKKCSCPLCGNKYVKYSNMYAHMRAVHGQDSVIYMNKPERPESDYIFKCDKCPKKYCQKKSLVKHKQSKHSSRTIETKKKKSPAVNPGSLCPICGKVFTSRNHLTAHVRQHTGERPFKCDFCERSFLVVTELNRHRRQHTGDKPHKCEKCGKGFVSAKYLRQHMASHSDERPNKCNQCERRYKFAQDLKIHMLTHTGERPFICTVCGDSFQRPVTLRQHRKIHELNVLSST
ncbi:Zinc finger protein 197 [Lucilia cuprina]|nr:Zinc finger protein 197 [Lucilia cuprina]KAI8129089.1 Zinc finger protein 197 [Lucilia cuprina]KAI8129091.1 Zinc finger protein 197 [Lucilia cuprina]